VLNFRQAFRSWLPDLVQHWARQCAAWRILCHIPHRGQNARRPLLLSATVLLWEGHSCGHLTERHTSQNKRHSLLIFDVYLINNVKKSAWRRAYVDYLLTGIDSILAQRQIILIFVLHSPTLDMISCCPPKLNVTLIANEIYDICRSKKNFYNYVTSASLI
jgi:hypothetical protein